MLTFPITILEQETSLDEDDPIEIFLFDLDFEHGIDPIVKEIFC